MWKKRSLEDYEDLYAYINQLMSLTDEEYKVVSDVLEKINDMDLFQKKEELQQKCDHRLMELEMFRAELFSFLDVLIKEKSSLSSSCCYMGSFGGGDNYVSKEKIGINTNNTELIVEDALVGKAENMPEGMDGIQGDDEKTQVKLDKVQFSAVVPKMLEKEEYFLIDIIMYEESFQDIVQEIIANADEPVKETKSGVIEAERQSRIKIILTSPDFDIEDNNESQVWQGDYLRFSFAVNVPEEYVKKQVLFVAAIYINDIITTKLKFVTKIKIQENQTIEVTREDVLSAFVSYASQDRNRVAMIVQGMKKARPDMDIFFDVDSLRSGEDWENALWREIDKRDVLFLCWSKYAKESKWVDAEWRYAFQNKGVDSIEPIPIELPSICPPPSELSCKHFSDRLLYIINKDILSAGDE